MDLGLEAHVQPQSQAARLSAMGSLIAIDGHVFASRKLQGSYALVEVRGYPNVGVQVHGNPRTRTDEQGLALVSGLLPFQANGIRLDPNDVPLSAELDSIELSAVPAWRNGTAVRFPVRTGRAALLRFVLDDGEPVPPGAVVEREGDDKAFFTARRGEAFVTGLNRHNRVRVHWKGGACEVTVDLPADTPDDIPRLGPLYCSSLMP
jgi:outer membrane usher protein